MSLIVVSNRLPVTIGKTIEKSSGGLVYAMEGLDYSSGFQWIGWAGGVVDEPTQSPMPSCLMAPPKPARMWPLKWERISI